MKEFVYTARDAGGMPVEGRIAAENSALAVARLRAQGLSVERIRPATGRPEEPHAPGGHIAERVLAETLYPVASGVSLKDLALLYRQLATLIGAGMALYQSLVALENQTRNPRLRAILREAQSHVMNGGRLSEVMDKHRYVFADLQRDMIRTAEHAGTLEETTRRLADYLERELQLRRMISRLTLYPKLVLLAALFILGRSFFLDAMPAFSKLIIGSLGKVSYSGLDYAKDTVLVLVGVGLAYVAVQAAARTLFYRSPSARVAWEHIKLGTPAIGKVVKAFALTRFGRAFSALYGAGVPLNSALASAARASGSAVIGAAIGRAMDRVERGESLSQALTDTAVFEPMFLDMLRTGEQTGNLDTMVTKAADYLESEAETRAHQYAHVFSTAVYLVVAIMVGYAVVSFYMSYASGYGG